MKSLYARFVLFLIAPAIRAELARQAQSAGEIEQFGKELSDFVDQRIQDSQRRMSHALWDRLCNPSNRGSR